MPIDIDEQIDFQDQVYYEEYGSILHRLETEPMSAEEVGKIIMKFAQYFSEYNIRLTASERRMALVAEEIENRRDENNKPITSAKAKVFLDATAEASQRDIIKTHLQNVENCIAALKSLQKGLLNEFHQMSST
jgi:hypothetical protein